MTSHHIAVPNRPFHTCEAARGDRSRFEGGMDSQGQIQFLSLRKKRIMVRMSVGRSRVGKRRDERAFATVFGSSFEFRHSRVHVRERQMSDRNQLALAS